MPGDPSGRDGEDLRMSTQPPPTRSALTGEPIEPRTISRISILICTHNRSDSLRRTLGALEALEIGEGLDREVIVVDNASKDRTADIVAEFNGSSSVPVRYVFEGRLGKSTALNAGIALCSGDVIAFTDDDAIPAPDWLDRIAEAFAEGNPGIVFGRVDPLWETGPPSWFDRSDHGRFALLDLGAERFAVTDPEQAFYGVNLAIRRELFDLLGGFRTDKGPRGVEGGAGEDTDLYERALAAGVEVVYDPKLVVHHCIPAARCSKAYHRERVKLSRVQYHRLVLEREGSFPRLAGLPRYRYRLAASQLARYLSGLVRRDEPAWFHAELELRRFLGLVGQAMRRGRSETR
jgi:glycosyltransferase involved in cell wall biosynthesis